MSDSPTLRSRILSRIGDGPARRVWTASDFADLGARDAIDKTLQRLVATNALRRIDRGLYDKPNFNSLTRRPAPPDPHAVIEAVVRRDQIRVLVDGMTAANDLGLTNAVPARIVVHTDARLKPIRLDNLEISFRPTAASKLYWAGRPAMRIVQALHWLRDTLVQPDDFQTIKRKLSNLLRHDAKGDALRADLSAGLTTLPVWMQDLLKPLLHSETPAE